MEVLRNNGVYVLTFFLLFRVICCCCYSTHLLQNPIPRPAHTDHPRLARWLVHSNTWGVVSTTSLHLGNSIAFGNALSYSDGPVGNSTGRLLFYLTTMDSTAQDVSSPHSSPNATLTICEAQLPNGCIGIDPEDPVCAKLSITGVLQRVSEQGIEEAQQLLFSRHPDMMTWPQSHDFKVYELQPVTMRLLDYYGGPHDVAVTDYFDVALTDHDVEPSSL